jgi:hypothetical protein
VLVSSAYKRKDESQMRSTTCHETPTPLGDTGRGVRVYNDGAIGYTRENQ